MPTSFMDLAEIPGGALPEPDVTTLGRWRENFGVIIGPFRTCSA